MYNIPVGSALVTCVASSQHTMSYKGSGQEFFQYKVWPFP